MKKFMQKDLSNALKIVNRADRSDGKFCDTDAASGSRLEEGIAG
jgi:hypothetical protein